MKIVVDTREQAPFAFSGDVYRGTEVVTGLLCAPTGRKRHD